MKLYNFAAPNPWRVRAYLMENGVEIPLVEVTRSGDGSLIVPAMDLQDSDTPSGTSAAYELLVRLGKSEPRFAQGAGKILTWIGPKIAASPDAWVSFIPNIIEKSDAGQTLRSSATQSAPHVNASAQGRRHEDRDEIEIRLKIAPGYHVNANPASLEFLVPTRVTLPGSLKAKISYPPGRDFKTKFVDEGISVYDGEVSIKAELASGSLGKKELSKLQLEVQACTDKVCLEPSTISVPVEIR